MPAGLLLRIARIRSLTGNISSNNKGPVAARKGRAKTRSRAGATEGAAGQRQNADNAAGSKWNRDKQQTEQMQRRQAPRPNRFSSIDQMEPRNDSTIMITTAKASALCQAQLCCLPQLGCSSKVTILSWCTVQSLDTQTPQNADSSLPIRFCRLSSSRRSCRPAEPHAPFLRKRAFFARVARYFLTAAFARPIVVRLKWGFFLDMAPEPALELSTRYCSRCSVEAEGLAFRRVSSSSHSSPPRL